MSTPRISVIAAIGARTRVLGKDGDLVYKIAEDLKRFRELTNGHPVVMGRKTWESLPESVRPLPGRANFVITRQTSYEALGAAVCVSVEDALLRAKGAVGSDEIFIIGGGEIYSEALSQTNRLYLTLIDDDAPGDTLFPEFTEFTKVVNEEKHPEHTPPYTYKTLERP